LIGVEITAGLVAKSKTDPKRMNAEKGRKLEKPPERG
jgi:hypothetical protein